MSNSSINHIQFDDIRHNIIIHLSYLFLARIHILQMAGSENLAISRITCSGIAVSTDLCHASIVMIPIHRITGILMESALWGNSYRDWQVNYFEN
ncbi:hypothetical protein IIC38_14825 [candidate division KSB1 bacterium]|nr:hypothetical protein [candidate division KSB1 bacterium]